MKLVIQRVIEAYVSIEGSLHDSIGVGFVVFLCIEKGDERELVDHYAAKVIDLRIFDDDDGKMNLSIREVAGEILLVSQFTLAANAEKGRRPSFDAAAPPDIANELYEYFASVLRDEGVRVATGVFQEHMRISLINDGPVTILLGQKELVEG